MSNDELLASHELIKESGSDAQTAALRQQIEDLEQEDLEKINNYLNAGVAPDSNWQDYYYALCDYEWYQVEEAFRKVMGRDLSLD